MAFISPEIRKQLHIKLSNVRLAYPRVFEPVENSLSGNLEYSCQIRLYKSNPDHMKQVEKLRAAMKIAAKAFWGNDAERNMRAALDSTNTRWLREDPDGEYYFVNLKRRSQDGAPRVVARDHTVNLRPEDGKIYGGAFVTAIFDLWCYSNSSKGFSATLMGLQFVADGDPIGGASVAKDEDFDDLSAEDGDGNDFI